MRNFLDKHFLLNNKTAERLYFDYAAPMPIIDYHCHLPPHDIAQDRQFANLTQVWLHGDHYKWRAMRTNGIDEKFITGDASYEEKFGKWAATVPYTLRNPLYHWTHLELQRYFEIYELLSPATAARIYDDCNAKLNTAEYSVRNLLRKMNVRLVCTTDDPADDLRFHRQLKEQNSDLQMVPAFRPDAAMNIDDAAAFNTYLGKLEETAQTSISNFNNFLEALKSRHDYFASLGCCVSDHGLEEIYTEKWTQQDIDAIFAKVRAGGNPSYYQGRQFRSAMLIYFAEWDHEKKWVQQYHLGALRNNNSRMKARLGADSGWDSIGDFPQAKALSVFLDTLDKKNKLAKTILYNLNPADNEVMATMVGNFNDGSAPGKMQWGSAWWFLDQKEGMLNQINALSNMGLLSRFVGMLTDSRSFLSYPRHEYFRRILCNLFGGEIEKGELPNDIEWTGKLIQDICYNNARDYFNWNKTSL